jgi:hypothetical protein
MLFIMASLYGNGRASDPKAKTLMFPHRNARLVILFCRAEGRQIAGARHILTTRQDRHAGNFRD